MYNVGAGAGTVGHSGFQLGELIVIFALVLGGDMHFVLGFVEILDHQVDLFTHDAAHGMPEYDLGGAGFGTACGAAAGRVTAAAAAGHGECHRGCQHSSQSSFEFHVDPPLICV